MRGGGTDTSLKISQEQGMTLIEFLVALVIFSVIIVGIARLYNFAYGNMAHGMNIEQLQHQTQDAMIWMQRDVQQTVITTDSYPQEFAGATVQQTPITTTDDGYGFIIYEGPPPPAGSLAWVQVYYTLTAWQNGMLQLQRRVATLNSDGSFPTTYQLATLVTGVSCSQPPFTASQFDPTTYTHQSLTIATLTVQSPHAVEPGTNPDALVEPITTFTMQGNAALTSVNQGGF